MGNLKPGLSFAAKAFGALCCQAGLRHTHYSAWDDNFKNLRFITEFKYNREFIGAEPLLGNSAGQAPFS